MSKKCDLAVGVAWTIFWGLFLTWLLFGLNGCGGMRLGVGGGYLDQDSTIEGTPSGGPIAVDGGGGFAFVMISGELTPPSPPRRSILDQVYGPELPTPSEQPLGYTDELDWWDLFIDSIKVIDEYPFAFVLAVCAAVALGFGVKKRISKK